MILAPREINWRMSIIRNKLFHEHLTLSIPRSLLPNNQLIFNDILLNQQKNLEIQFGYKLIDFPCRKFTIDMVHPSKYHMALAII